MKTNLPGNLVIRLDHSYRYGKNKFPIWLFCRDIRTGDFYTLKDIEFELNEGSISIDPPMTIGASETQELINDLYNIGIRPSDEIKKDDLILMMQKEIDKRDQMIDNLMNQFVFKDKELITGRKAIL
jgi:hypothetical protein